MGTYSTSARPTGDPDRALQAAVTTFAGLGFRIDRYTGRTVSLAAPGRLNSTSQNPALGASNVIVSQQGGQLSLEADLGGAEHLVRFVRYFPPLLGVGLGLTFVVAFSIAFSGDLLAVVLGLLATIASVAPWLFISPVMARRIMESTRQALDTIVANACTVTALSD